MTENPTEDINENGNGEVEDYPSFLRLLSEGFRYLHSRREGKGENPPGCILPNFLHHVCVNFIDPTTSSIATTSSTTAHQPVQLYEKFCEIFERDYQSTLSYVPYELFRNNSNGVIERLPVKTVVARSHGGGVLLPDDDAAKSAVHDYSWERPYCYIYLAACESLEHYRTKVKPSIQAFVSQLEAANRSRSRRSSGATTVTNGPSADSPIKTRKRYSASARYVIIYIPTGNRSEDPASAGTTTAQTTTGLASRFAAAARQRMSTAARENAASSSGELTVTSTGEPVVQENDDDATTATAATTSQKLSKTERETAKRFNQDFPSGNVCTLSHLSDVGAANDSAWEKLEWNTVMKAIGTAIAGGFQDRCHRFDEELRKLDLQRRGDMKPASVEESTRFHLVNFFLVKESLAFTYEQMRLPGEALLQYEELRAFLPDTELKVQLKDSELELLRVALSGDVLDFRSGLRGSSVLEECRSPAVEEYIFARELALLFQMHKSGRIAKRSVAHVQAKFQALLPLAESPEQLAWLHQHCFQFCWDFRVATQSYLQGEKAKPNYQVTFARSLCDLLEFARQRLLMLGKDVTQGKPLIEHEKDLVSGSVGPWEPWSEEKITAPSETDPVIETFDGSRSFVLEALSSEQSFRYRYLDLTSYLAEYNEVCGRHRYAARLRLERMELFDSLGHKKNAAAELLSIVDVYDQDSWNMCQFSLMFRLATFHRSFNTAREYLDILVRCFSKKLSAVAPKKALGALHADLVAVLDTPNTRGSSIPVAPLLWPIFGLEGVISQKATGTDRSLLKRLYTLGENVAVTLALSSFLPEGIQLDSIVVNLVPFPIYVSAMEDNTAIKDSDIAHQLTLENTDVLSPGENRFTLDWQPPCPGQFILASCAIAWKGVRFTYSAKELKRPTIRIDIVPGKPTQTLQVSPAYLLPGHEQRLSFKFSSGSDVVEKGSLQIVGSPGVSLKHEIGDSQWLQSLEAPLPSCSPSETVSVEVIARTILPEDSDASVQPLRATLSTAYKCGGIEADTGRMETELEANVPVRSKAILSVSSCSLLLCGAGKAMLSIVIRCNTPSPFKIKDWTVQGPPCVILTDQDEDLNASLREEVIIPGDTLQFCFSCTYNENKRGPGDDEASFTVTFDENGIAFCETTKLNISWPNPSTTTTTDGEGTAKAKAHPSSTGGSVGEPIELTYTIDCATLTAEAQSIYYEIDFDDSSWIVSGNIHGKVDLSKPSCCIKTVAIPVQPGETQGLPTICLFAENATGISRLKAQIPPAIFTSTPHQDHSAVAFPITKGVTRRGTSPRIQS